MSKNGLTRRGFLRGVAFGAAGVAGASMLGGCSPQNDAPAADASASETTDGKAYSFEVAPNPVSEEEIVESVEADIVVVGGGVSGTLAALAAAKEGASVVILQKGQAATPHGGAWGAFNTRLQEEGGYEPFDLDALTQYLFAESVGYGDYACIQNVVYNSGACTDLIDEIVREQGWGHIFYSYTPLTANGAQSIFIYVDNELYKNDYSPIPNLIERLHGYMTENLDVEIRLNSAGEQLEKDETGRVVACVASTDEGYLRAVGRKAVIVATGDCMNNPEMLEKYAPFMVGVPSTYEPAYNTGDGQKMMLWSGAKMMRGGFAQAIHHDPTSLDMATMPYSSNPYLFVNDLGLRYENEDLPYPTLCNSDTLQPNMMRYQIVDSSFSENWNKFLGNPDYSYVFQRGGFLGATEFATEDIEFGIESGAVYKADTLEELADMIGYGEKEKENFLATCKRYQELVEKGVDEDFHKDSEILKLTPVKTAPFYALPRRPGCLALFGGVHTTENYEVLDDGNNVIPGLYAVGNTCNGFFNVDYCFTVAALSVGRAFATGYIAGKHAARA